MLILRRDENELSAVADVTENVKLNFQFHSTFLCHIFLAIVLTNGNLLDRNFTRKAFSHDLETFEEPYL